MSRGLSGEHTGELFIVATPIGNLADMVPRAVEILQNVDFIAAEDTRHSGKLMQQYQITTPLVAYHDYTDESRVQQLLARLKAGERMALISDAGTPLISDPGYRLVHWARQAGIRVTPVPGPCALIAALCASGLPSDRFCFEGFLPAKTGARQSALGELKQEARTLVFYESPHRIEECLQDAQAVLGADRPAVMARELTKTFETFLTGSLAEIAALVAADANQRKGEIVLMVQGYKAPELGEQLDPQAARIMEVLLSELPVKQAASLAAKITGEKKNKLYQWALAR
jgi:16S rRNA (cytidine1402-2'-O)-methyltransferase